MSSLMSPFLFSPVCHSAKCIRPKDHEALTEPAILEDK